MSDDVFVLTDALRDERFADNPLVTNAPRIRFYAGVPLRAAAGARIGMLCVIDSRPRDLSPVELRILKDVASLVEREFERDASESD
jgi:GAF domain-containing protein